MPYVTRDGVRLAYFDSAPDSARDSNQRTFLFVHGWTCDHSYFAPQADYVTKAGHRAISVDLRGHGTSDQPEGAYPIEQFADDTAYLIGGLGLDRPVAVGHSMGGLTVLALAARHPEAVRGIVMVDPAPLDAPASMREGINGMLDALEAGDSGPQKAFVENALFHPTDDPELKARVAREMTEAAPHVCIAAMRGVLGFDGLKAAAACKVPALHIAGDPPLNRQGDMAKALSGVVNAQTSGAGHFNHLIVPVQVNDMIDYFARTYISW